MLDEQTLLDLGLAIDLLNQNSGQPATFNLDWFKNPLTATNNQLKQPAERERLIGALEQLLERAPVDEDGVARFRIPNTPEKIRVEVLLRPSTTGIRLGVSLGIEANNDQGQTVLVASLEGEVLEYQPAAVNNPAQAKLEVLQALVLRLSLALTPPLENGQPNPFERMAFEILYTAAQQTLELKLLAEHLQGLETSPIEASFTLDLDGSNTGWEAQLVQLGLFGLQVLLAQLIDDADATLAQVARLVMEHLLPLFGWIPGPVAGINGPYQLPALNLVQLVGDPPRVFQQWLNTCLLGGALPLDAAEQKKNLRALATHLGALLSFNTQASATDYSNTLSGDSAFNAQHAWGISLRDPNAGTLDPLFVLWTRSGATPELCLGLRVEAEGPLIGTPNTTPDGFLYARPTLNLTLEALSIPLTGPCVLKLVPRAALAGRLGPVAPHPYALKDLPGVGASQESIEHLEALEVGLTLLNGQTLVPRVCLVDLKIGTNTWQTLDLTSGAAWVELGVAATIDAVVDALKTWLGDDAGEDVAALLALSRPASATASIPADWPLVVPAPVNGQSDPQAIQKTQRLLTQLPAAYRSWLYELLDPASNSQDFVLWLDCFGSLLKRFYSSGFNGVSGTGTGTDPWRVRLLDTSLGQGELELALCFQAEIQNTRRALKSWLRVDGIRESVNGSPDNLIDIGLELDLLSVALNRSTPQADVQMEQVQFLQRIELVSKFDSDLRLDPPSLNLDPGHIVRAELGEAIAAFGWQRGQGIRTRLSLSAARIVKPDKPNQTLLQGPLFELIDLQPSGELGSLSTQLLLATMGLEQAGASLSQPGMRKAADALLGLGQFMGWLNTDLMPNAWPSLGSGLDSAQGLSSYLQSHGPEGMLVFLTRRLRSAQDDSAGVGVEAVLDFFSAWVGGRMADFVLNPAGGQKRRGILGSRDNPYARPLVVENGKTWLELLVWEERNQSNQLTGFGVGVAGIPFQKDKDGIAVTGEMRADLFTLGLPTVSSQGVSQVALTRYPLNLRYDTTTARSNGTPLYYKKENGKIDQAGSIDLGLAWDEVAGLRPTLSLVETLWQAPENPTPTPSRIDLDDPGASPLLNALQNMPGSPFGMSAKHPAMALFLIFGAVGLFSLGAGGAGGFLAQPLQRFRQNPNQYLREQFIDPATGVLRLHALVHALDGQGDSAVSLLQLLDLKRDSGEKGLDLSLEASGALRLRAYDSGDAGATPWLDVSFNPVTRAFVLDVSYDVSVGTAYCRYGNGRPFQLGVTLENSTLIKLLGSADFSIVPPNWMAINRVLAAALGGAVLVIWLYLILQHRVGPWMAKDTNALKPVFIAAGLIKPVPNSNPVQYRFLKPKEIIEFAGDVEKNMLQQATLEALSDAIKVWPMFRRTFLLVLETMPRLNNSGPMAPAQGAPPREAGAWLRWGSLVQAYTAPINGQPHSYTFGRMVLGQNKGGLNVHLKAGGPWKGNAPKVLDSGTFDAALTLGGVVHLNKNNQQKRLGLETTLHADGELAIDLILKGPDPAAEERVAMYPVYNLSGLRGLLGLGANQGSPLIALLLERIVKSLHTLVNPKTVRDLLVHLLMGLGTVKKEAGCTTYVETLKWNPTNGELVLDVAKVQSLTPSGVALLPAQLDFFWLSETLFDVGTLLGLQIEGVAQDNQPYNRFGDLSPAQRGTQKARQRFIRWRLLRASPSGKPLDLSLVAGNYPDSGLSPHQPGFGVIFDLHKKRSLPQGSLQEPTLFRLGDDKTPVLWGWLEPMSANAPIRWGTRLDLPLEWRPRLPLSQHELGLVLTQDVQQLGQSITYALNLKLMSGRKSDLRGMGLLFNNTGLSFSGVSEDGAVTNAQGQIIAHAEVEKAVVANGLDKGAGILSLSATLLSELLLLEAKDGKAKLLGLDLPFVEASLGDILAGIQDTTDARAPLFEEVNGVWRAGAGNPAHLSLEALPGQLLSGLKAGNQQKSAQAGGKSGGSQKSAPAGAGAKSAGAPNVSLVTSAGANGGTRYGVSVEAGAPVEVLPFASILLGEEGQTAPAATLWLGTLTPPTSGFVPRVSFNPGLSFQGIGFEFHGKAERPLLEVGPVSLQSVQVLMAGATEPAGSAYFGAKLALIELALPLGRAKGETPANKMLSADGNNPAISLAVSYDYAGKDDNLKLHFTGGNKDERGICWFQVGKNTGMADIGRIGVGVSAGAGGAGTVAPSSRASLYIDGRFGFGPLVVEVQGFSISFELQNFHDPSTWELDLLGMGISYQTSTVSLTAALLKDASTTPAGYIGAALLKLPTFELSALGAWNQIVDSRGKTSSFFAFARFTMQPGIGGPPFFFVTGLAAGFGYNRSFIIPRIEEVPGHALIQAMSPPQGTTAMQLAKGIQATLPPKRDAYWLALGVTFTSFKFIEGSALLYVLLDQGFTLGLLGLARFQQPKAKPVVNIGLALKAEFSTSGNDPRLLLEAMLTDDSWVLSEQCKLTGGFALGIWFKRGDMVLSLGGYHPAFVKPAHYPEVRRVGMRFQPIPELLIKGESYFAITPRELMGGSSVSVTYFKANEKHPKKGVYAHFAMGFDARLGWDPFFYDFYMYLQIVGELRNKEGNAWLRINAGADLHIWGPKFAGEGRAEVGPFAFKFAFGPKEPVNKSYLSLDEFAKKTLLPDVANPLNPLQVGLSYALNDSVRGSVVRGRRPSNEADASQGSNSVLEVETTFAIDLRFVAPATEVFVTGGGRQSSLPVQLNDGSSVNSFASVDLATANTTGWRMPALIKLKNAQGQELNLLDDALVSRSVRANGFPAATFDLIPEGQHNSRPATVTLAEGAELSFRKRRGTGIVATLRQEGLTAKTAMPLDVSQATQPVKKSGGKGSVPVVSEAYTVSRTAEQLAAYTSADQRLSSEAVPVAQASRTMGSGQVTMTLNKRRVYAAPGVVPVSAALIPGTKMETRNVGATASPDAQKLVRQSVTLDAGGSVVLSLDAVNGVKANQSRLTMSGNQALRGAFLDKTGALLFGFEGVPTSPGPLPAGTSRVVLTGLGQPGTRKTSTVSPMAAYSALNAAGAPAPVGFDPDNLLLHAGAGTYMARGMVVQLQALHAVRRPEGRSWNGVDALEGVQRLTAYVPRMENATLMIHLRPARSEESLRPVPEILMGLQLALERGAPAVTLGNRVTQVVGSELAVLLPLSARSDFSVLLEWASRERLVGLSLWPLPLADLQAELAAGRGWMAVEDVWLSSSGSTQIMLEVNNG
ncbi:MAG: DUF6603 domain-containing protein [Myxococcota bacterium]